MADYNVDIVDHATGEVYSESLRRKVAIDKITREGWESVSESSEDIPGDGCGGGEGPFILHTLWVDTGIDLVSEEEMRRRAAAWWKYEEGGGRAWSDDEINEFAKKLMGV